MITPQLRETFVHTDDDGIRRQFDVLTLKALIRANPGSWKLTVVPLTRSQAKFIQETRSIEEAKVRALPLSILNEPGIACRFPDGSVLIVDGNHRLVKRTLRGLKSMDFWLADQPDWEAALIPEDTMIPINPRDRF